MPKRSEKRDAAKAEYLARKGRGDKKIDGARQQMGMYSKDSAFARVLKLQDALYKVRRMNGKRRSRRRNAAASLGTGTAPDIKTPPGATRAHRRAITTQRRMGLTAPSFLIR